MRKLEICCGSIEDVKIAIEYDIDSIELNTSLSLGGITPTIGTLRATKAMTDVPVYCMNRPVPGGFVYTGSEFEMMRLDGKILLENGADGLVFGCLTDDLTIDVEKTTEMIILAHQYEKQAIFHMAIDGTKDVVTAYKLLVELGIDRVLTSGGAKTAFEGIETLRTMNQINPDKLIIGAGINGNTIDHFNEFNYIHASCKTLTYRNNGTEQINQNYVGSNVQQQVDTNCVSALVNAIKGNNN